MCLIFHLFLFSRHISCHTVCISTFSRFTLFLITTRSYSVCFSFSTFFKFFTQIQVLIWVFFLFHIFHCFSPQSRSYSLCLYFTPFSYFTFHATFLYYHVSFSFSSFVSFLATFQFLQWAIFIFHVF